MKRRNFLQTAVVAGSIPICSISSTDEPTTGITPSLSAEEQETIAAALGKKGSYNEAQGTYSISLPRNDLNVTIKGNPVPIPFGFGGWVAFKKTLDGKQTIMMSDTVLLEAEVNPLIDAVHAAGLEIGAIHNHFFYEEPRIFYMHLHGMGETANLARQYAQAIRQTKLFPANQPGSGAMPNAGSSVSKPAEDLFDLSALDAIVQYKGVANGPTYKYTVGRNDVRTVAMGAEITAAIGLNSWASFAGHRTSAHIAGDIAMLENEVNNVIKSLRENKLDVVALHHHMLGELPRTVFLHYYGQGAAVDLAKGFRAALNQLGKSTPSVKR